ncbi:MAG TPA: dickkopf-related protein [Labilithrix sp.]|jgi:hypothetical protein
MSFTARAFAIAVAVLVVGSARLVAGCQNGSVPDLTPEGGIGDDAGAGADGAGADAAAGRGVGQSCDDADPCRQGLACTGGMCVPGHSSADGTPCTIGAECKQGSYCGPMRTCAPAGMGADGASCTSDADCGSGLRCDLVGLGAQCKPEGKGDVGGKCTTSADCFGGLACAGGMCAPLPAGPVAPLGLPSWKGADCADDPGAITAYFRVPRGSGDGDFFRLPFPNDVRRGSAGHPSLSGYPTPGSDLLGYDVVDRYVKDVEQNADGFSTYPTVTMRFSGAVDFATLKLGGAVRYVDVTPGGGGNDLGFQWSATTSRSAYVCPNWVGIRPYMGQPLAPGSTYAVFVTTQVKAMSGGPVARSADLDAMLAASAPADTALASAYAAYAPLRTWAAAKSFDLSTVLDAAVFTTAHASAPASKLAGSVAAAALPTATNWVLCGGATPSPCPDATGTRACGTPDPAFDELHALVSLPIFQKGTAPYLTPADGGDFVYDGSGAPVVQRVENVCMSLTIPKGVAMPASGWPLVVYAHGTGGSFRSHANDGTAKSLASVDDGAGGQVHMAVLGIDQVEHGPRRGGSTASPDDLFFNFANPSAARGNPLQGAADQISLARFARALLLPAASSPTGADIRFDRIAFWGHSQGATEGGIALSYVADYSGATLSGEGASLIDALVTKTSPVNIAAALPFVLEDASGVNQYHPVLTILQNAIDPADPLNHAKTVATGKHVFQPWGQSDTYTPTAVQETFFLAAGLGLASPPSSVTKPDDTGVTLTPVPASGNLAAGAITAFARQYTPSGFDGHFVAYDDPDGKKDVAHFLADVTAGKVPAIGR